MIGSPSSPCRSLLAPLLLALAGCSNPIVTGSDSKNPPAILQPGAPSAEQPQTVDATEDKDTPYEGALHSKCYPLPAACLCSKACVEGVCDNKRCEDAPSVPQNPCQDLTSEEYQISLVIDRHHNGVRAEDPGFNPNVLEWSEIDKQKSLIDMGGDTDSRAPKFQGFFADQRIPEIAATLATPKPYWEVEAISVRAADNEVLHAPASSYELGEGFACMVIYADEHTMTCNYHRADAIVQGYTLHVMNACISSKLIAAFQANADKTDQLPGLKPRQPFGRAWKGKFTFAIRDTGSLMDPRVRKDWW